MKELDIRADGAHTVGVGYGFSEIDALLDVPASLEVRLGTARVFVTPEQAEELAVALMRTLGRQARADIVAKFL